MTGGTTYEGTNTAPMAGTTGTTGHQHSHVSDEVVGERAVSIGIAEVRHGAHWAHWLIY
jgi:hypothetical protein